MADVRWREVGAPIAWRKTHLVVAAMCLTAALAACGGDSEGTAAAVQNPSADSPGNPPANPPENPPADAPENLPSSPPENQAPTIAGAPGTQVMPGHQYSFTP